MLEKNLVKWLQTTFNLPVYAFSIPLKETGTAFCYEVVGRSTDTPYHDGSEIVFQSIRLTKSAKEYAAITDDSKLYKYIKELSMLGVLRVLSARVIGQRDFFDEDNEIYERTYTIQIKFKEN